MLIAGSLLSPTVTVSKAQDQEGHSVEGVVTSEAEGETMPGVNVSVVGASVGTATDAEGRYGLEVPSAQDTLLFSFVGYEDLEVPIAGRETIDVSMSAMVEGLSEVVVTGYGEEARANVTGAITHVEGKDLDVAEAANTSELMAGVPGLITKQTSGLPGFDRRSISIRGFGDPLVLVDGMEMPLDRVDPYDIESISVLKDASAAVYGARAGNGVVLVKTKRGKGQSEPRINFSTTLSAQTPTALPEHVSAGQYAEMLREGALYMGIEPRFSAEEVENYKSGAPGFESYDWYDATFSDYAQLASYNMSLSGGGEAFNYFVSGIYKTQNSALKSDDHTFDVWSARANVDTYLSDEWTASLNLGFRSERRKRPGQPVDDIFLDLNRVQPIYRPVLPDESRMAFGGFTRANPIASSQIETSGFRQTDNDWVEGKAALEHEFNRLHGLTLSGTLGFRYGWENWRDFRKEFDVFSYSDETDTYTQEATGGQERIGRSAVRQWEIRPELALNYRHTFAKRHDVEALALVEYTNASFSRFGAERRGLFTAELPYLFAGDLSQVSNEGFVNEAGRQSYVGRVQYAYDDRYRIEGTLRADASHKFPSDSRWGYFPSVSAGWSIHEEAFMSGLGRTLSRLKLRLSYGQAGDDDVGAFQHLQGFTIRNNPWVVGGRTYRILAESSLPNPSITWRTMTLWNAGLDATLWNGLLSMTADVFQRDSDGLFGTPQDDYPDTFGASLPQLNINATRTRGFELELGHTYTLGDFTYRVGGNMTMSSTEWTEFAEPEYETDAERRVFGNEGRDLNRRVGYVALGLFQSQEEIDNWDLDQDGDGNSTLRPGDIKYKDLDGDGKLTFADQERIGYGAFPDLTYAANLGASYGNWSLDAQFQGASRFTINITGGARVPYQNELTPFTYQYEHRWRPQDPTSENPTNANEDAKLPYIDASGAGWSENNNRYSSFWLKDGTYLRLKNLSLSYALPGSFTERIGVQGVQVSLAGTNLFTWDRLGIYSDSYDPESPGSSRRYPLVKTYQLRLGVTL